MTPAEFRKWVAMTRLKPGSRGYKVARLQLVDGLSAAEAARQAGYSTRAGARGPRLSVEKAMRASLEIPATWQVVTVALPPGQAAVVRELAERALAAYRANSSDGLR